jgi:hypothetical protein
VEIRALWSVYVLMALATLTLTNIVARLMVLEYTVAMVVVDKVSAEKFGGI